MAHLVVVDGATPQDIKALTEKVAQTRAAEHHKRSLKYIREEVLYPIATRHLQDAIWRAAHSGQSEIMILRVKTLHRRVDDSVWNELRVPYSNRWPLSMIRVNRINEKLTMFAHQQHFMNLFIEVLTAQTCIDGVRYEWRFEVDLDGRDCETLYAVWK